MKQRGESRVLPLEQHRKLACFHPATNILLPLAHILLRVKCRYMSLVCINVTNKFFCRVFFFQTFLQPGGKPV